jgi:hypothetical protein
VSAAAAIARQFVRNDPWSTRAVAWCVSAITSLLAAVVMVLIVAVPQSHARFQAVSPVHAIDADPSFRWMPGFSGYREQGLDVLLLEAVDGREPPTPVGLERFPLPGEAYVSPALASVIQDDPALAARIPGTVVGTIAPEGLASPRTMRAVAATDLHGAGYPAETWGNGDVDDPHSLPEQGARMLLLTLGMLPWLVVLVGISTSLAARLRTRAAALALIGASRAQVRRFVATSVAASLVTPGVAGATAGVLAAAALGPTGVLGLDFSAPGWGSLVAVVLIVAAVQCGVAFIAASISARRAYRSAWSARTGPSAPVSRWGAVAAAAGAGSLVLLIAGRWAGDVQYAPSATTLLVFLTATLTTLVGAAFVAARWVRSTGERVSGERDLAWVLGWRDVAFRTTGVMTQTAMLATVFTVFVVASGVQLMTAQIDRPGPATWWTVSVPASTAATMGDLAHGLGPGTVLSSGGGEEPGTTWGTCESLTAAFGTLRSATTGTCEDDRVYDPGDLTGLDRTDEGDPILDEHGDPVALPISVGEGSTRVVTTDPAGAEPRGDVQPFYLLTRFVDAESAQTLILGAVPAASFSIDGGDYVASVQAPRLERITVAAAALGLLIALAGLATDMVTASPTAAALRRLGASRAQLARRSASRALIVTGTAVTLALVCAVLIGQAYLAIGSLYLVDVAGISTLMGLAVVMVAVAAAIAWLGRSGRAGGP